MKYTKLDNYMEFTFQTQRFDTGAATDADSDPGYRVYEENNDTVLSTGTATKRDDANTTGYYYVRFQVTSAAGYEATGKYYEVRVTATVNSVAGAAVIGRFAVVQDNVFDSIYSGTDLLWTDTRELLGSTAQGSSGYVLVSVGTGVGQIDLSSGQVKIQSGTGAGQLDTTSGQVLVQSGTGSGQLNTVVGRIGINWADVINQTTSVNLSNTNVGTVTTTANVTNLAANSVNASALGSDAVDEIVDQVWNEVRSGHTTPGTFGEGVSSVQGNVTGSVGSVAAGGITAASIATDAIDADALAADAATEIADALLKRDLSSVSGEAARSLLNAIRVLVNKWAISGSTLTVYKEDDATPAWTGALSTSAGDPVKGMDPA